MLDLYCAEQKLAIEVDGQLHNEPSTREYDEIRSAYLKGSGIRVIRFTNEQVVNDTEATLIEIAKALTTG